MSEQSHSQEFHENVNEYFPDYGSLQHSGASSKSEKKGLIAKLMAGTAALAAVLLPYVICSLLFLGDTTATISTRLMNLPEDAQAFYLVSEYPGKSDQALLEALSHNPELGTPVPASGSITLQSLSPLTRYRLIFFARGTEEEGIQLLPGTYSFRTGTSPRPEQPEVPKHPEPERPLPPEQPEIPAETPAGTEPTEATTETTEPATEPTTEPTEAATEPEKLPTEPTTRPTNPPSPPPVTPDPPPTPPDPPPVAPDPPPAPPEVTAGAPTVTFTARSDGKFVFSPEFPFSVKNAKPSRAEFVVTHTHADGTTTVDFPVAATVTETGTGAALKFENAEVNLSEGIRIEPVLYYKDGAGVETKVPGTAYEAAPAGFASDTGVNFRFEHMGDHVDYTVDLSSIKYPAAVQPADSSLIIESMDFTFIDNHGNPADTQTVTLSDTVTGSTYSKTGTLSPISLAAMDCNALQVKVNAAWKVGGQNALLSSTTAKDGAPAAYVVPETATLDSASSVPGTNHTNVTVTIPFTVQNATARKISIQAVDGGGNVLGSVDDVPVVDPMNPGTVSQTLSCEVSPGQSVSFNADLEYEENGEIKHLPGGITVAPAHVMNIGGSLNFNFSSGIPEYTLYMDGIVNPANGDNSSIHFSDVCFVFTPAGGGTPVEVHTSFTDEPMAGVTMFEKKDTVILDSVTSGDYNVHAVVSGKWRINGADVQELPTTGTVNCGSIVTVP